MKGLLKAKKKKKKKNRVEEIVLGAQVFKGQ